MRAFITAAFLAMPASASAESFAPDAFLEGLVQESDIALAFSYFREALSAAMRGREVSPPYQLQQRGMAIGEELKRRGAVAGEMLLDEIERGVREEFRRPRTLPSDSAQRI